MNRERYHMRLSMIMDELPKMSLDKGRSPQPEGCGVSPNAESGTEMLDVVMVEKEIGEGDEVETSFGTDESDLGGGKMEEVVEGTTGADVL